jgi:hypothetical protein
MMSLNFKKWNNLLGWFSFAVALVTYSLTVEPTLSFWDCGEYIATSTKLQVGHPPGAPLFQMIGAFFSMFATDVTNIALMVNMVSAVSSAFTILFMFWSLTLLLKRVVSSFSELNDTNLKAILGASLVASLAFTFSDTFWYSAVEAEVYAMSSLFIAILFWMGLRWEADMDKPNGNRWLLGISLFIGLSFGVHLMALLTIPSIGLLYYFKHYKEVTIKNFIIANVAVVAILFFVFKFLLPYTMAFFGKTEIFMVNSMGLPFNSGTIFASLLVIAFFVFGLRYTKKKNYAKANTFILCILFIFIGFSSWLMLPIRANANVVINENRPSDAAELLAYYNREQYGEQKTFYGALFSEKYAGLDPVNPYLDDKPNYERDYKTGKYVIVNNYKSARQNLDDAHKAFLPRMRSTDGEHPVNYMKYTGVLDFKLNPKYDFTEELYYEYEIDVDSLTDEEFFQMSQMLRENYQENINRFKEAYKSGRLDEKDYHNFMLQMGDRIIVEKPSFLANMQFMFEYQFGYMFGRYLMWNFSGRQNDIQGKGDMLNGNWITGINVIDDKVLGLGNQSQLTSDMKENKGRNVYFMLPFIFAVIGLVFHARKDWKSFYVLLALFLFMGIALKIFLNERPFEPRERDYAVVGAFYVFAMWIAFGVYAVYDFIREKWSSKLTVPVVVGVALLAVPVVMGSQNWDDHDRSGKYTALASAKAYLDSCDQNAIIFTIGDNDTFPLWYLQEVEGYRTDVRVVCTALLVTDWYIDQMKAKAYESDGLPISFEHHQYSGGKLEGIVYRPSRMSERISIDQFLEFIHSDDPRTYMELRNGQRLHTYPTNKIRIPVNRENVLRNGIVKEKDADKILPYIDVDINAKGGAIYIHRLMMLDIIANNNWERPIYFSGGAWDDEDFVWMKDYLQLDGMIFQLVPIKTPVPKNSGTIQMGRIDTEKMYNIIVDKSYENGTRQGWFWGGSGDPNIYHDVETRRNAFSYRLYMSRLVEKLIEENKYDKAKNVIDLAMEKMPVEIFGQYEMVESFIEAYYIIGEKEKARELSEKIIKKYQEEILYYESLDFRLQNVYLSDIYRATELYRNLLLQMRDAEDTEYYEKHIPIFNQYNAKFKARLDTKDEPSGLDSSIEEDSIMNMLQNMDSTELNSLLEELQIAE